MAENVLTSFSPAPSCFTSPWLLETSTDTLAAGELVAEIGGRSWTRHEADDMQRVEMSGQPAFIEAGGVRIVELTGDGPVAPPGAPAHTKYAGNTVQ